MLLKDDAAVPLVVGRNCLRMGVCQHLGCMILHTPYERPTIAGETKYGEVHPHGLSLARIHQTSETTWKMMCTMASNRTTTMNEHLAVRTPQPISHKPEMKEKIRALEIKEVEED